MNRKRTIVGLVALVVLTIVVWRQGWLGNDSYSEDPAVAEMQRLRDEQFAKREQMSEEQMQAGRKAFESRMAGLSEEQRRTFFESSAPFFMKMMSYQIDRFNAMSPDEQRAHMDRRIDEMQARGGPNGGNFPQPNPQQLDQMRKRMLDWTTPEDRAKFEGAMAKFSERLKERGLNPGPGGGFF